ncbi:M20/M25/M40 family metallo-hydrolase [Blastococcus sp. CT_GayMR16]|uniref:M20/M25/M40 family metallo-hydrolase n=1 Tax=Blastococcus sp. CT_GayMR16 TaxID=2559607 RepID=UPI0010743EF6|nr:M20/M25/M40 family metallo-hydrolase [Blastococcus sp. CT_GayMR16]TFV87565.1 M20/M25/M40 family metallo-hydrolase [Blastococcus sp. CT_GayMR16]
MPAERSRRRRRVSSRAGRVPGLILVVVLLGLVAWSVAALQPPAPRPADAPTDEFSAARAFEHVQQIAAQTHVAGSDADAQVVEGLVDTLSALGLDTRVQNSVGAWQYEAGSTEMARVRNVVAVLPGSDPTGRLFLMAHHDSVETGPGAADDAAGVSALLEAVRALAAGPQLRNDVVVVLTDAEEACLCGAEAFADSHPLAAGGGVVLNFEARGTSGPPIMFETSRGNAGLADAFAAAAPHPVASSFAVEVYRALPNDTDFSVLLGDGDFTGLNTAFIDGAAGYHTPQDVPERLDRATLQALGDNALAVARELGDRDLVPLSEAGKDDASYFPVLGRLVRYPGSLVWPLAGAALLGVAVLALVLRRRGISTLRRTAAGTALALVPLVLAPLAAQGLWSLLVLIRPDYGSMLDPWRPGWYRLATVAVVLAVVLIWYALLRRRIGPASLAAGGLVWLAVLAAVLAAVAPGGSYLAAWPALAGAVAGILVAVADNRVVRLAAALVAGAVAVVVLAPTVALFFPALGLRTGVAPSFVATMMVVALLPAVEMLFADPDGERGSWAAVAVPGTAVVLAVACAAVGLSVDRFDAEHPVPSQLVYALDSDTGQAWWASTEDDPGAYTAFYVDGRETLPVDFPYLAGEDVATGPAQAADLPAPGVTPVSDVVVGGKRQITVRVAPQRPGVRLLVLDLSVEGGTVTGAQAAGRDVPDVALGEDRLWITFHAPPPSGLQATFTVDGDGPVQLRVIDGSDGLSGLPGFEPRPDGVDAAGTHSSDLVLVGATTALG